MRRSPHLQAVACGSRSMTATDCPAFSMSGLKAGFNPTFVEMSQLALSGLALDVEVEADGRTNLQKVVGAPTPRADEAGPGLIGAHSAALPMGLPRQWRPDRAPGPAD